MSSDHEHESREILSNMSANSREVRRIGCGSSKATWWKSSRPSGWIRTRRPRVIPRDVFSSAMFDSTDGYEGDPKLITVFDTECRGGPDCRLSQVVEGPIQFFSLCEHHALPFYGRAYVGYIAHEQIIGLSKLTRLVRLFAKRFTVQERIGQQIADSLDAMLHPHGVAVYLDAHHLCTQMRGVRETAPLTRTTFWRGNYESDPSLRTEFFVACGLHRFEPGSR